MASSAPSFVFDREPPDQQRARQALAPAAALAAIGYVALDRLLTSWLGGVWGVLLSLLLVTAPLGAVWWSGERGVRGWRAWRAGLLLGGTTVLMYAWLFVGSLAERTRRARHRGGAASSPGAPRACRRQIRVRQGLRRGRRARGRLTRGVRHTGSGEFVTVRA